MLNASQSILSQELGKECANMRDLQNALCCRDYPVTRMLHFLFERMSVQLEWTILSRSSHTERGLPQRTAVSVRCGMLHSKQTLLTIIF